MHDALLTPIVQALSSTEPLDPYADPEAFSRFYVDRLHPGRFGGALRQLELELTGSGGGHQIYLFSGTVGSGKSTELRRLAGELRARDWFVAVINITEYLNPEQELNFADLLVAMAMGLEEALKEHLPAQTLPRSFFDWVKDLLGADVGIDQIDLKVIKLNLKQQSSFREHLRSRFAASPGEFLSRAQQFFAERAAATTKTNKLMVVDSLEHFGGRRGKDDPILASLRALFQQHADALRIPQWQTVYSVPPLLTKLAPGVLTVVSAARLYQLTSAHVFVDRSSAPDEVMLQRLFLLVDRRCGGADVRRQFIADAELRRVVLGSGGDLRDLIRLLRLAALFAYDLVPLPIEAGVIDAVFDDWRNAYLPLAEDTAARLAAVLADHQPRIVTDDDWFDVMGDLAEKRLLLYRNGTDWYGVHPLLRDALGGRSSGATAAPAG